MRHECYQQFAIVQGDTAQSLTEQLNAKMRELSSKNPTVTFEGLIARISYMEDERVPESVSDEYEARGVRLTCGGCPYYQPGMKADGTVDKRAKRGGCPFAHYGMTFRDNPACNKIFEQLELGEVKLCLAD